MNFQKILAELKRRNVLRVATMYLVAGWLIIQIVAVINEPLNLPDKFDTITIIVIAVGLPVAMIFAWVFEFTPAGLKKTDEVEVSSKFNHQTNKKLNRLIMAILALVITVLIIERVFFAGSNFYDNVKPSIAVMPFVNMSSDSDNEYFSDGLSEELLNGLAKIEQLKVAARTSAFSFKGKNEDLRIVGELLNVAHILEGSVRKDGNKLRITAQLIRASDGYHMWSETYDREMAGIFKIQEEISRKVIEQLRIKLLPNQEQLVAKIPTENVGAYNAYLKATQWEVNRKASEIDSAILYYQKAITLDPTFGLAYARLAYSFGIKNDYGNLSIEEMEESMRENIDKALVIEPSLAQAYLALGLLYQRKSGASPTNNFQIDSIENQKALSAFKKAYELSPNDAPILERYQSGLGAFSGDSLKYIERALELDPLNPRYNTNYANLLQQKGNHRKALSILKQTTKRTPEFPRAYIIQSDIYSYFGDLDSVMIVNFQGYQITGDEYKILRNLARFSSELGLYKTSDYFLDKCLVLFPQKHDARMIKFRNWSAQGKISKILSHHDDMVDGFGPLFGNIIYKMFEARDFYFKGEYEEGLKLMEDYYNEIPDETKEMLQSHPGAGTGISGVFPYYKFYRIKAGKIKDTFGLTDSLLSEVSNYFIENDTKSNVLFEMSEPSYIFLEGNQKYDSLKERILADKKRMRDNVVAFLKKEKEWLREWED